MIRHVIDRVRDVLDPDRSRFFPSDDDAPYGPHFPNTARVFERFLALASDVATPAGGESVAVVVMPWFETPVPWYSVALGLGLASRGRSVVFVWHDLPFPTDGSSARMQDDEIGRVLRKISDRFEVVRLTEQVRAPEQSNDGALVNDLVNANLTWIARGGKPTPEEERTAQAMRSNLESALPHIRTLLGERRFRYAVVPGGIVGPSGLYSQVGRSSSTRVASFDSGVGAVAVSVDRVAAQSTDIGRAFRELSGGPVEFDAIVNEAKAEFERRRTGRDPDAYQHSATSGAPLADENSVLLPLSVVFDAAALGRHHIFSDTEQWLVQTVEFCLTQSDSTVVVRQHPSERRPEERSRFDPGGILASRFGTNPLVRFVESTDDVSTYDLLQQTRLVVPFVSTIGIEAAAMGRPVVVAGDAYYSPLGFVHAPATRSDYFELVGKGLRGELTVRQDQINDAWRCYYLTAVCNRVRTNFTPQPKDFWRWVRRAPSELLGDPAVEDILTAIDTNTPLAIVRHRRRRSLA